MAFMPFPQLRRQQPIYREEPHRGMNVDLSGGGGDDMGLLLAMIQMQLGQQENARRGRIEEGQLAIQQQLANAQLEQQKFALEEAARARTAAQYAPILERVQRRAASSVGKQIEDLRTTYASAAKDNGVVALNKDIVRTISDYQENPSAANREKLQGLMAEALPRRLRGIAESANQNGEFALRGAIGAVAPTIHTLGGIVETDEELRRTYNSLILNLDPMLKFADPSALQNRLSELERFASTRMEDVTLGVSEEAQRILNARDAGNMSDAQARMALDKLGMSRTPKIEESPINPFQPYGQLDSLFSPPERVAGTPGIPEQAATAYQDAQNWLGRLWYGTPARTVGGSQQAPRPQNHTPVSDAREFLIDKTSQGLSFLDQLFGISHDWSPDVPVRTVPVDPRAQAQALALQALQGRRPGASFTVNPATGGQVGLNTADVLRALLVNPNAQTSFDPVTQDILRRQAAQAMSLQRG